VAIVNHYIGYWNLPEKEDQKYIGELLIEEDSLSLVLWVDGDSSLYKNYADGIELFWGVGLNGENITVENCRWIKIDNGFKRMTLKVENVYLGYLFYPDKSPIFKFARIEFPNLSKWLVKNRLYRNDEGDTVRIDLENTGDIFNVEIADGLRVGFCSEGYCRTAQNKVELEQNTVLCVKCQEGVPLNSMSEIIEEYVLFVSVIMFSSQQPKTISLSTVEEVNVEWIRSAYSSDKYFRCLVDGCYFETRFPELIKKWHLEYNRIGIFAKNMIKSMKSQNDFDYPDFLRIVQSLEGYFKRYVNIKETNGKNMKKLNDEFLLLLNKFNDITILDRLNIDITNVIESRNYYSHLHDKGENKTANIVNSYVELKKLTEKLTILLSCCILSAIGMTNNEIQQCCKQCFKYYRLT